MKENPTLDKFSPAEQELINFIKNNIGEEASNKIEKAFTNVKLGTTDIFGKIIPPLLSNIENDIVKEVYKLMEKIENERLGIEDTSEQKDINEGTADVRDMLEQLSGIEFP